MELRWYRVLTSLCVSIEAFFYLIKGEHMRTIDLGRMLEWWQFIVEGLAITIQLSLVTAILGIIVGLICALLTKKKFVGSIVRIYIDIFRGTPVFFQLYFIHYGLSFIFGYQPNVWVSAIQVFTLNSGAYLCEIMRAGLEGIDKGQIEAAKALGVSKKDILKDILIPQAVRNVLPALINEFITLTKETSVVSVIGINDMMKRYTFVMAKTFSPIEPLIVIGIAYYLLNKVLSYGGKYLERKLKYD